MIRLLPILAVLLGGCTSPFLYVTPAGDRLWCQTPDGPCQVLESAERPALELARR